MLRSGTLEERLIRRVFDNEKFRGETEYLIQTEPGAGAAPQAFLATQAPGWTLPTHFHLEEQFQVVVEGGGTLGRETIVPLYVHYASREAGYGPIIAGPDGLKYLTLRAIGDVGAWYMPESRETMRVGLAKRHAHGGPCAVASPQERAARTQPGIDTVIVPDQQGLAAWLLRLGPRHSLPEPLHAGGGGRFLVVVSGEMQLQQRQLRRLACTFASLDEPPVLVTAGEDGADVLVLQYPASALPPVAG